MKRIIIGVLMVICLLPNIVKAETYQIEIENRKTNEPTQTQINYIYNTLMEQYPNQEYDYYIYNMPYTSTVYVEFYKKNIGLTQEYSFDIENDNFTIEYDVDTQLWYQCTVYSDGTENNSCTEYQGETYDKTILVTRNEGGNTDNIFSYMLYDTSIVFNSQADFELEGFYSDNIVVNYGENLPKLKDLYEYESFEDYETNHVSDYNEINLNNYEYVILNLKDYSQNNAFNTNLYVKGQIGITPVYNYGQTAKDSITGVKVQDRCNAYYENYTAYPLYILQTDLQNSAVYIVKSCENNSSFKYDKTIFDITYVTNVNKDDPVITIDGKQYHVIPFEDLPSTANQNEEENYIPGESGSMNDTGGIDGAIKGIQQKMGEIWDTITYFTGFINQMFSILPTELKTILMSAFIIAITLGLIKIFIN